MMKNTIILTSIAAANMKFVHCFLLFIALLRPPVRRSGFSYRYKVPDTSYCCNLKLYPVFYIKSSNNPASKTGTLRSFRFGEC